MARIDAYTKEELESRGWAFSATEIPIRDDGAVRYDEPQDLSDDERETARNNIAAVSLEEFNTLKEVVDTISKNNQLGTLYLGLGVLG